MAARCSGCVFTAVCVHLGWVKCRALISSMGYHTWPRVTSLSFSLSFVVRKAITSSCLLSMILSTMLSEEKKRIQKQRKEFRSRQITHTDSYCFYPPYFSCKRGRCHFRTIMCQISGKALPLIVLVL